MIKLLEIYNQILKEAGGQDAGEHELHELSLEDAVKYCKDVGIEVDNIEHNLKLAMDIFSNGVYDRDEMPVMTNSQVEDFEKILHTKYGIKSVDKLVPVKEIKPMQKQVYLDKSVESIAKHGVESTIEYLKKTLTVMSNDGYLIDGHHRLLSGLIIDPDIVMKASVFDTTSNRLMSMALSYSDKIGNERND